MFDRNRRDAPGSERSPEASDHEFGASLGGELSVERDDLFRALAAWERRHLLSALLEEETLSLEAVVDLLVGHESVERGPVGSESRQRIVSRLHHVHIPSLEDAELITFDPDAETVELRDLADETDALVRFACEGDRAADESSQ